MWRRWASLVGSCPHSPACLLQPPPPKGPPQTSPHHGQGWLTLPTCRRGWQPCARCCQVTWHRRSPRGGDLQPWVCASVCGLVWWCVFFHSCFWIDVDAGVAAELGRHIYTYPYILNSTGSAFSKLTLLRRTWSACSASRCGGAADLLWAMLPTYPA